MNNNKKMSAAERQAVFNQLTRKHVQTLPTVSISENSTMSFSLPKARLLQTVSLIIEGDLTSAVAGSVAGLLSFFRQIRLQINNGFAPFRLSGEGLFHYNRLNFNGLWNFPTTANGNQKLCLELPVTLNTRDAIGLINLQNPTTEVTVEFDVGAFADIFDGTAITGGSIKMTPVVTSFSIPSEDLIPDLGILKITHEYQNELYSGESTIKMPVGTIFRKLLIMAKDGLGIAQDVTDNIKLILNQADVPYNVHHLHVKNEMRKSYEYAETGLYVFDFSNQGLPNFGGSRDYIDTERLTEFWVRLQSASAGSVKIVAEMLSRLEA